MAIVVYTGVMGSGKSYEAVATAALTALRDGRRVVTNVSGFNYEKIRDYLGEMRDGSMLEPDRVLVVPSSRITEPGFFYDPEVQQDSVVKPGDLVLVDEVWAFWGTDCKLQPEHQKFFRMHRHYTEVSTGTSCDLVIMIQDLMSLHRFIRGVLESNLKFTKLKSLGLSSRYRVEVYEGNKQRKASFVSASIRKYDKQIFPLYKSYDGGAGRERVVDGRQNIFNNRAFLAVVLLGFAGFLASSWWFVNYVRGLQRGGDGAPVAASAQGASAPLAGSASVSVQSQASMSADQRLVAVIKLPSGETMAVIEGRDGRVTRQRVQAGLIDGWDSVVGVQGRMVSFGHKIKEGQGK